MNKAYIGIDPGNKGYLTCIDDDDIDFLSISDSSFQEVSNFLLSKKDIYKERIMACMEEVHAIYGSGAKSTFEFGKIYGRLIGLLTGLEIPYSLIPPKMWQKEMWINDDKVYKYGKLLDTKPTSIRAAKRLFPNVSFKRTDKCKKDDDNKCDSILIAEYARRKNL